MYTGFVIYTTVAGQNNIFIEMNFGCKNVSISMQYIPNLKADKCSAYLVINNLLNSPKVLYHVREVHHRFLS
jgi:hypothetical protein